MPQSSMGLMSRNMSGSRFCTGRNTEIIEGKIGEYLDYLRGHC